MKTIFEKQHMKFTRKDGSVLTVKKDEVSYEDAKKEDVPQLPVLKKKRRVLIFHLIKFPI